MIAIGPCTNLALLEVTRPGALHGTPVTVMGGWVDAPVDGLPPLGPEMDWNIQWDTRAAEIVAATAELTLATLPMTLQAHLRTADLPRLRASGPLGELVARQCEAHTAALRMLELGRSHACLPDDLLNFHYDPVACAVALGWSGAVVAKMCLRPVLENGMLRFQRDRHGRSTRVAFDLDGERFRDMWRSAVEAAQR